jgi:hypothetical protein
LPWLGGEKDLSVQVRSIRLLRIHRRKWLEVLEIGGVGPESSYFGVPRVDEDEQEGLVFDTHVE